MLSNTRKAALAAAVVAGGWYALGDHATGVARQWGEAQPVIERTVEKRQETDFGRRVEEKHWWVKSTDELLDQAADILSAGEAKGIREGIRAAQTRIVASRKEISDLRFKMATAPESSGGLAETLVSRLTGGAVAPSKETYRARISGIEEDIRAQEADLQERFKAYSRGLAAMGVNIPADQVEGLLTLATGDDITSMMTAFAAMKAITASLQDATVRQTESIDVARRYYAIYVVLAEIALKTQSNSMARIDADYLPKLDSIAAETQKVKSETLRLMSGSFNERRTILQANVESQDLTIRAASLYRSHLLTQRASIDNARRRLEATHEVALNTYRTVRLSADLVGLMRTTSQEFAQVLSIELPNLRPFEGAEMKAEFEKLSAQLKKSA